MSNRTALKRKRKKKEQAKKKAVSKMKPVGSGGLNRKIVRIQQKLFMKNFKKTMSEFRRQVACVKCGYHPKKGENIDDWHIDKTSNNIDLICTSCYTEGESEETNENSTEL
jgi:hypothetical protein